MGCFSFICKKSGKPANSNSFSGDLVHLFLLKKGKVIEHMYGQYDSYGRVFTSPSCDESFEWQMPWGKVCDLMFDKDNSSGIAVIRDRYWHEGDSYPTTRSEDDPNQGWGEELEGLGDCSGPNKPGLPNTYYHKVFTEE